MARKVRGLRQAMSPEAQVQAHEKAMSLKAGLPLAELRQARQREKGEDHSVPNGTKLSS